MSRMAHAGSLRSLGAEVRSRPTGEIVRRVAKYLRPYPWRACATIICAILSLAASFAYPKLTRFVIDDIIGLGRTEALTPVMLAVLAAFFLRDAFNGLRIWLNNVLEQDVIFDIRREVYGKLQRLPSGWFDNRSSGDVMTRVIEDVNSVERLLIDGTEQGLVAVLSIVGVMALLFASQPMLAGVALIPLPFLAGGALWYTLTAHRRYRKQRVASSAMNALLMDNLQGVRQIKSFGREHQEEQRFADHADALRRGTLSVMRVWSIYNPAMTFGAALGTGLVMWVGGHRVMTGQMTVGQLLEFVFFLGMFYTPVGQLHGLNQMLQSARAAGERVFDILDAAEEPGWMERSSSRQPTETAASGNGSGNGNGSVSHRWKRVTGAIQYEDVGFSYGDGRTALCHISFRADPGEVIALVGPTGAGKTTLVNLLPRLYERSSGSIRVDGRDIRQFDLEELRQQIAVVSQEPFLFNGSLRENLLFGCPTASEAQLTVATRAANCHEFISRMPTGYDTLVGERGVKLSVGEKQRVSIARALLKDAPILILDEATASVDTATEGLIQQALERLMERRTSLVIAHRLSTIRGADQVLVLKGGQIVERGTHDALLLIRGLYSRLWNAQSAEAEAVRDT
jgi:ATP-binding cassette subfamily B protein